MFLQNLEIGEGPKNINDRKHLAFESNVGDSILYYQGYSVIYSYYHKLPLFTFHHLTIDQLTIDSTRSSVKRSSSYFVETLPNGTISATNIDYKKSGYDRGHMVPAGDFVWDKELKDETFYYTNINPQIPTLNRGIWRNLEIRIRGKVLSYSEGAYVVTGVVFNPNYRELIGPNNMPVPVAFFKMVYFVDKQKIFAFLFDNTIERYYGDLTDFQVTVDFIEKITNEDFFDLIDDEIETKIESIILNFNE
ncbi:DNA/RNA non-specific endonuclease [Candidatus Neomarinimicrobiota bacterium]